MKKVMTLFLFTLLLVGFVSASDVAYIVKDIDKSDAGFSGFFENLGLNVELIDDSNIGNTDFSEFDLIFVGDERLKNVKEIPMDVPIIVANRYYVKELGLIESGSISQSGSSDLLSVEVDEMIKEVYTTANYGLGKTSVPYYYIPHKYKPASMESIAMTPLGGKMVVGTVIGYLTDEGVNKCFFGIAKSMYWTDESKELFENCVNFVLGEEVSEGEIHDVDIVDDLSNSVNGLRIKDVESNEWLLDEVSVLQCGRKYKVDYKTVNVGDFTETINFFGMLGNFNWSAKKTDLLPGKSTTTGSKTITINQEVGEYDLEVTASLESGDDDNPENNFRSRKVIVECD